MISFVAEFLALVILTIVIACTGRRSLRHADIQKYFFVAVILNMLSIFVKAALLAVTTPGSGASLLVINVVQIVYGLICFGMIEAYAMYVLHSMLSRVDNPRALSLAIHTVRVVGTCAVTLLLTNPITSWVYNFNANGTMNRGPMGAIAYLQAGAMIVLVVICAAIHRKDLSNDIKRILGIGIPAVLLLLLFQALYPQIIMDAMIAACVALILQLVIQRYNIETDPLTGLGNQLDFLLEAEDWKRRGNPNRIFVVRLDHMRSINATYGSDRGDRALYKVAKWACGLCARDNVYRISQTSFALVFPTCDPDEGDRLFASIVDAAPHEIHAAGQDIEVSLSFIDYTVGNDGASPEETLERIEYAQDKMQHEEAIQMRVDAVIAEELDQKKELTSYLEDAVKTHRFRAWVQPIYDVRAQTLISGEILCRLDGPDSTMMLPGQFIPIAEESRLITDIGKQTFEDVCGFLGSQTHRQLENVSINLSMQQLVNDRFVDELEEILNAYGICRNQVSLEITERMLVSRDERVAGTLARLHELGYTFLMDDFGTGFSSIAAVFEFPFGKIKIDKTLVDQGTRDGYETVCELIGMFHRKGHQVVIEGVETAEQAAKVIACGADFIQGFYFAQPMPLEDYPSFLNGWQIAMG